MKTSQDWITHFEKNASRQCIDWSQRPAISPAQKKEIIRSLQAWQLGETSDGSHLLRAASQYANQIQDELYVKAVKFFISEEQKHGANLGKYLDAIGEQRLKKDWGDTLFRKVRYYNTSMEIWTIAVIIVESFAQLYYQAIADATNCKLLKQICKDILIDEAHHIKFQLDRLCIISSQHSELTRSSVFFGYRLFFFAVFIAVWFGHARAFKAGGVSFNLLLSKSLKKFNFISKQLNCYCKEQKVLKSQLQIQ
jgi:hypothetical protein